MTLGARQSRNQLGAFYRTPLGGFGTPVAGVVFAWKILYLDSLRQTQYFYDAACQQQPATEEGWETAFQAQNPEDWIPRAASNAIIQIVGDTSGATYTWTGPPDCVDATPSPPGVDLQRRGGGGYEPSDALFLDAVFADSYNTLLFSRRSQGTLPAFQSGETLTVTTLPLPPP